MKVSLHRDGLKRDLSFTGETVKVEGIMAHGGGPVEGSLVAGCWLVIARWICLRTPLADLNCQRRMMIRLTTGEGELSPLLSITSG